MEPKTEERRLVIEIISTLVHIKRTMIEFILKPAGVPKEIYQPLLYKLDEATGHPISKRKIAPLIVKALDEKNDCQGVIRRIVEIAANWSSFHLADDEYAARATVQKAREIMGTIKLMEEREEKQRELARKGELARMEKEREENLKKQSELLLMMYDEFGKSKEPRKRGHLLEDLLNRIFDLHGFPVNKSFRRNSGGEEIDGSFKLESWYYIVECKWQKKLTDIRQLDSLKGKVDRSGKQTMGLFLSIEGWSKNVCPLLKQNPVKSIILMDGYDLRCVLNNTADLRDFLLAKIEKLNYEGEPFLGAHEYLKLDNRSKESWK
jgi:hypothetical protein